MARVIVILALMLAITAAMVAITRKSAITPGEAASEPSATVHLTEVPDAEKDQETELLKSTEPRTFSNTIQSAAVASSAPTASAQEVAHGPVAGAAPAFGTAGIDHKGNASFTGTATPGDAISLMSGSKTVGSTTADDKGTWSLDLKALKSNREQELLVSAQGKDGTTVVGPQRAIIAPPAERGGLPRITLKAAEQTVTATKEVAAAPAEPKTGLVVEKVASGDGNITLLSGKADPGATVKVAINDKLAGEAQVDDAGAWSIAASNPSGKAADSLRLELLDKSGATLDKTDVPYKVPAATTKIAAAAPVAKSEFPSVLTSKPSPRKKPSRQSHGAAALSEPSTSTDVSAGTIIKVRRGDSLWRIARRHLGKGKKWAAFYKANKEKIDNPDLIYPGQVLVIPG